jgi:flagellar hook-associated protein 3 FlgL
VISRITQSMTARMLLADIGADSGRLAKTQQKIASGKEITVPSDDPFATGRALDLRSNVEEYRQYQRNVGEAGAWQDVTDTALKEMTDLTLRARELVVQGATDTVNQSGRNALANEIDQIVGAIKAEANVQYAGRYVFSGTQTTTQPYNQTTDVYAGDANQVKREIGRGVQIPISTAGSSVVGDGSTGLVGALRQIASDLRTPGSTAALGGADLKALDVAHEALVDARGVVGAVTNRLEVAQGRLGQLEETTTKLLSETEDADMAKTLVDFSMQQAVYQAALKAGAQLIQPSLLDFLR